MSDRGPVPRLYHWTRENHLRDLAFGAGFHPNQGSARLHQVEVGDSLWEPTARYGRDLSEAHHLHWLSRGGDDAQDNLVLLCPNHHRAVHAGDAPFDFGDLAFVVETRQVWPPHLLERVGESGKAHFK